MFQPIAIIGVSFELPRIKNWSDLVASLHDKDTFVDDLSSSRLEDIYNRFGETEMSKGGHIKNIDLFDPEYFGISKREAIKMTPEQRYFLMHALNAFYDAGYTEDHLKATNTGIYYTAARSSYKFFLGDQTNDFNKILGMEGTRVANYLDLRGPVISIDTTCSSSLVALHQACLGINHGEFTKALVGGVRFHSTIKNGALNSAVMSNDDDCKPFDEKANGLVNGEGVICIVIKALEKAEKDGDPIYGVIKTSAVNHGGARIASLTAPNSEAQKEVMLAAWNKVDLNPADIKFIEAHGTGTILGDPIEFEAIQNAYRENNVSNKISTSSFKGQIGHLDTMSGLSGLLRLLAAVNANVKPVQANFSKINSLIDESRGVVEVQRASETWSSNGEERIGGVNSFGLTGTNAHIVVSSYDQKTVQDDLNKVHFIQIGEKSPERLRELKKNLVQHLNSRKDIILSLFSQKINRIYTRRKHNEGFIFSSRNELIEKLSLEHIQETSNASFFLLSLEGLAYEIETIHEILKENILIKDTWNQWIGQQISAESIENRKVLDTLFQYVIYKYLENATERKIQIVTKKDSGSLRDLLNEKISVADLLNNPGILHENEVSFDFEKFLDLLKQSYADKEIVVIRFSKDDDDQFLNKGLNIVEFKDFSIRQNRYELYGKILENGMLPLRTSNAPFQLMDLSLPEFTLSRFWPEAKLLQPTVQNAAELIPEAPTENKLEDIHAKIVKVWKEVLEMDDNIKKEDDFFYLGGTSLDAIDMFEELHRIFPGTQIKYEEMYEYSVLKDLIQEIHKRAYTLESSEV